MDEVQQGSERTQSRSPSAPGSLGDMFERKGHLFSTRSSEAYEAVDVSTASQVLLWVLRYSLSDSGESAERFSNRLKRISVMSIAQPAIKKYGIGKCGTAYLATEFLPADVLFDGVSKHSLKPVDVFLEILNTVAPIHRKGLVLGDIGEESLDHRS